MIAEFCSRRFWRSLPEAAPVRAAGGTIVSQVVNAHLDALAIPATGYAWAAGGA